MTDFTRNWTNRFIDTWTEHLIPLAGSRAKLTLLEIGIFEGRSGCWFLNNVLTSLDDQYIGIDPWEIEAMSRRKFPRDKHGKQALRDVEERARINFGKYGAKAVVLRGRSTDVLTSGCRPDLLHPGSIDIAYIDGVHLPLPVLIDSALVWPLIAVGGVMFWDDYRQSTRGRRDDVKRGVDAFLSTAAGKFETLWTNRQMGIRKTAE